MQKQIYNKKFSAIVFFKSEFPGILYSTKQRATIQYFKH